MVLHPNLLLVQGFLFRLPVFALQLAVLFAGFNPGAYVLSSGLPLTSNGQWLCRLHYFGRNQDGSILMILSINGVSRL